MLDVLALLLQQCASVLLTQGYRNLVSAPTESPFLLEPAVWVGKNKLGEGRSSHENNHFRIGGFKWQGTKVSDTWQKYTAGDGGSSCTTLICYLTAIGLFYPFQSTVTFPPPRVAFPLHPCSSGSVPPESLPAICSFLPNFTSFTSCEVMSSLGLFFTCLGAKVWKWKVQREVQKKEGIL